MPTSTTLLTPRDLEVLAALDRTPLTVEQLLKLSRTFERPFTDARRVRERLQQLAQSGRVRRWRYATAGFSAPIYYTLSRLGYQLLHGPDEVPPARRSFGPVGNARQHHSRSLADFIVHTAVCAGSAGWSLVGFCRENSVRLRVGDDHLYPDCAFQLVAPGGAALSLFVELDNCSERVHSPKDAESWERKLRLYDRFQDLCRQRFRVLVIPTRGETRLRHILDAAGRVTRNPQRSLVYGVTLPAYLACEDAVAAPIFLDHRGRPTAIVTQRAAGDTSQEAVLSAAPAACYTAALAGPPDAR
jgi:hypothetical protein